MYLVSFIFSLFLIARGANAKLVFLKSPKYFENDIYNFY